MWAWSRLLGQVCSLWISLLFPLMERRCVKMVASAESLFLRVSKWTHSLLLVEMGCGGTNYKCASYCRVGLNINLTSTNVDTILFSLFCYYVVIPKSTTTKSAARSQERNTIFSLARSRKMCPQCTPQECSTTWEMCLCVFLTQSYWVLVIFSCNAPL